MPERHDRNATPVSLDTVLGLGDKPGDVTPVSNDPSAAQEARLTLQLQAHEDHNSKKTILGGVFDGLYGGEKDSEAKLAQIATEMRQARLQGDTDKYKATASQVDQAIQADKDALWTNDLVTGVSTGALKAGGLFMAIAATKGKAMFGAGAATFALYGLDQAKTDDTLGNQASDFALGGTKGVATAASFKALSHGEMNPMARGVLFGTSSRLVDLGLSRETYHNQDTNSGFDFSTGVERTLTGTFASRSMIADALLFGVSSKMAGGVSKLVGAEVASSQVFKTVSTSSMFGLSSGLYAEFTNQQQSGEFNLGRLATRGLLQATADGLAGVPAGKYSAALAARTAESTSIAPPAVAAAVEAKALVGRPVLEPVVVAGERPIVAPERPVGQTEIVVPKTEQPITDAPKQRLIRTASDITLADGTRIIEKLNGTKVTVYKNGDRVLEEPGAAKITFKTDGRVIREMADGKVIEHRTKFNTPLDERPLNIASGGYEAIGKALSNFTRRPFTLDGKQYESVEGFYQGLKWSDPAKRAEVAQLSGPEAKSAGRGSKATSFDYEGKTVDFRSPEHYALMKRAIKASLEQNPAILAEFQATEPRPMEHKTGRRENPNSGYPSAEFIKTLLEVRSETIAKGDLRTMTDNTSNGVKPVSDIIKTIKGPEAQANHDLKLYAEAFKDSGMEASSVVATGRDAVVLKLADGNILKITTRTTTRAEEPFDMPVLSSGIKAVDGRQVRYSVQPEAGPATRTHLGEFLKTLTSHGYRMTDPGISQIGLHEGTVKLLDPYAVSKN